MSERPPGGQPPIDHEIDVRGIGRSAVWMTVVAVAAFVISWGFYRLLDRAEQKLDAPPSPLAEARAPRAVPGPALQTQPETTLAEFRRAEEAQLRGWGWVDRGAGVARVPVDHALEQIAADGALPDFSAPLEISQP